MDISQLFNCDFHLFYTNNNSDTYWVESAILHISHLSSARDKWVGNLYYKLFNIIHGTSHNKRLKKNCWFTECATTTNHFSLSIMRYCYSRIFTPTCCWLKYTQNTHTQTTTHLNKTAAVISYHLCVYMLSGWRLPSAFLIYGTINNILIKYWKKTPVFLYWHFSNLILFCALLITKKLIYNITQVYAERTKN